MSREDRALNANFKKRLDNLEINPAEKITMRELKKAISKMKAKGASGPDDIPPQFLKHLGPLALEHLLRIFNLSLATGKCPQIWRNAIIIPLLKVGKPAGDLASF